MTLCRLIAPDWLMIKKPETRRVLEGLFTNEQLAAHNKQGYNVYYLPNHPSHYESGTPVDGTHIDVFNYVFVDCDLKDGIYPDKESFFEAVADSGIAPSKVIDSGNGMHVYWRISNLDPKSYLRFQRRLMRLFKTDDATTQLFQLMRLPGFMNMKAEGAPILCDQWYESDLSYTCEALHKLLPAITNEDEQWCVDHYDRTHNINQVAISDVIPPKFGQFIRDNQEAKELWAGDVDDRSKSDYRLAHLMFANNFTAEEAASVLVNSAKALDRAPIHRISYARNIIDKIWTFELAEDKEKLHLSQSVRQILARGEDTLKGTPFRCHPRIDNTNHGFRLGQVIGLVAGSGVGKTAFALNMFQWFAQNNPDYDHFFIPLEQPPNEIADRWRTMCGTDTSLHDKVHVISNYDEDGAFRHLSFEDIKEYIAKFQRITGKKIGCVVIDHIGALKKEGKDGENQDLMDICHSMKAFAVQTNTLLVMQSQTSRPKAGIGDLELDKDAAYGTVYFESYCDYLITLWQPLKRCHAEETCPTVTAFKFCKIRHKKPRKDIIQEDVPYFMYFDSDNERMRDLTQEEIQSFNYFLTKATNKRKADKKADLVEYKAVPYVLEAKGDGKTNSNRHTTAS